MCRQILSIEIILKEIYILNSPRSLNRRKHHERRLQCKICPSLYEKDRKLRNLCIPLDIYSPSLFNLLEISSPTLFIYQRQLFCKMLFLNKQHLHSISIQSNI